jgi:Domain of unknown function (DUF4184)
VFEPPSCGVELAMPFPLADPSAAVPFRRCRPKSVAFSALVVGCIVADLAASIDDWEYFPHTMHGWLCFLPTHRPDDPLDPPSDPSFPRLYTPPVHTATFCAAFAVLLHFGSYK